MTSMKKSISDKCSKAWAYIAFVLPGTFLYVLFVLFPFFGGTVVTSFTKWSPLKRSSFWVGLKNYQDIWTNEKFLASFSVTIRYMLVVVIITNLLGLLVALLIEGLKRGKSLFRNVYFIPYIISPYLGGFIWLFMFTAVYPEIIGKLGWANLDISWFGNDVSAFWAVSIVTIWQQLGFIVVMYIAGLQTVPQDILEASLIDGATGWQQKIYITIPAISNVITINLFLSITNSFRQFDIIYAMTKGGPGYATRVTTMDIYMTAFSDQDYGLACAKAVVFMAMIVVITFLQLKLTSRKEVEV